MEDKLLKWVRSMKMRKLLASHNSGSSFVCGEEDILAQIFLWLPLESLVRFKRLSKKWYFLISDGDSYFRRNYFSTLSTRKRNRIVGNDDNSSGIMAGFFIRKRFGFGISYHVLGFIPYTCTQFKKYSFQLPEPPPIKQQQRGEAGESTTTTTATTAEIININKMNPFSSLVESLDGFLSARLQEDKEAYPPLHDPWSLEETFDKIFSYDEEFNPEERKLLLAASSNGFLLFTLFSRFSHSIDFLINPVTMEWLAFPQLESRNGGVLVGFVCKGDYPSLDLVEFMVVRLSWLEDEHVHLLFQLFSNGDKEYTEYRVSCKSLLLEFNLCGQHNSVIISSSTVTNNNNQGGGGGGGSRMILLYFLVRVKSTEATAIVAIDLNVGDGSLQMFETPGPDRGDTIYYCDDYIREFGDDGLIHYVRFCCSTDFEFWVLNTENGEWYLKHRASLKTMMMTKGYPSWTDVEKWNKACMFPKPGEAIARYHIHGFHPMNPNLIFLTLYGRFVCYNIQTRTLELVFDFDAQNMMDDYSHLVYQWPYWPPLL